MSVRHLPHPTDNNQGYFPTDMAYNVRVREVPLGPAAFPHIDQWRELPGLVADGTRFSWLHARAGYIRLRDGRSADPAMTQPLSAGPRDGS